MKMEFLSPLDILGKVVLALAVLGIAACASQSWDVGSADPVPARSDDDGGMGGGSDGSY